MKFLKSLSVVFLLIILFASCVGPKALQRQINKKSYESVLIFDSEKITEKPDRKINFEIVNESTIPAESTVLKNDGRMLWLLLFYTYNYDMTITLGDNASNPSALPLVENALTGTFDRSGAFKRVLSSKSLETDYKGIITIKELNITCDYYRKGMGFWSYTTQSENADNSTGKVKFNLKLYNNEGSLLLDKDYTENRSIAFATTSTKIREVKKMTMKNLIENLTLSSQAVGLAMTNDINDILETAAVVMPNPEISGE